MHAAGGRHTRACDAIQLLCICFAVAHQVLAAKELFAVIVNDCSSASYLAAQADFFAESIECLLLAVVLQMVKANRELSDWLGPGHSLPVHPLLPGILCHDAALS